MSNILIEKLKNIRKKIQDFLLSEKFVTWRKNLTSTTNFRNLSIINAIGLLLIITLFSVLAILPTGGGIIFISLCILLLNLVFAIFPFKNSQFESEIVNTEALSIPKKEKEQKPEELLEKEGPPSPEIPDIPINLNQSSLKKPLLPPKIQLPPEDKSSKSIPSDLDLGIPAIPMKKVIKVKPSDLDTTLILEEESQDPNTKIILVECQICGVPIKMPVPKKIIEESDLPVTDVTYIHGEPPHAITAQLDRDFQVRRRRAAQTVFETKKTKKTSSKKKTSKKKISKRKTSKKKSTKKKTTKK